MTWLVVKGLLRAGWDLLARIPWQVWLALALAIGIWQYGEYRYEAGVAATEAVWQQREAGINLKAARELAGAIQAGRDREKVLAGELEKIQTAHLEEEQNAKKREDDLHADLRSSRLQLSIAIKRKVPGGTGCGDTAVAGGSGGQGRADLMPEDADALVGIALEGDRAMRKVNRLIDSYNAVRDACKVPIPATPPPE